MTSVSGEDGGLFELRPDPERHWIYDIWDISHPEECNHFTVARIDSNGAGDDLHEEMARVCVEALNARYAQPTNTMEGSDDNG